MISAAPDLQRFVTAQQPLYAQVLEELRQGRKRSHWMWFIFPQYAGLGLSATARFYAIASLDEAAAYWQHPVLGPRLRECTQIVNQLCADTGEGRRCPSLPDIFGGVDALKFRSCMTLFAAIAPAGNECTQALQQYCAGQPDLLTLQLAGLQPAT